MPRVFISWSGPASRSVAEALRKWLPHVLPSASTWVSSEDIRKGARWSLELGQELERSDFGIICLDSANLTSEWVHFEAGALAKHLASGRVTPLLLDIQPEDVSGPLAQFQMTRFTERDMRALIRTIAGLGGTRARTASMNSAFARAWPALEAEVRAVLGSAKLAPGAGSPQRKKTRRVSSIESDIVKVVAEWPDRSDDEVYVQDMCEELDLSMTKALHHLNRLQEAGLVSQHGNGHWQLTPEGMAYAVRRRFVD